MAFVRSRPVSIFLRLLLIAALTLVLVPVSPPQGPVSPPQGPAEKTPPASTGKVTVLHVFLAAGQSNMSGRGRPAGGAYDPTDPRIFQYGAKNRTFRPATVPLDMHDPATGMSPATTFAREYLKTQPPNVGVLIIPAAHGATAFTTAQAKLTWSVGVAVDPTLDLPALAVAQTLEGMAAAKVAGYSVDLKGVLWHQGEGNSAISTASYAAKLDELIGFFRSRFSSPRLPFVVGGMAPEGIATTPGLVNIDRAHRETPSRVAYTGFARSMAGGVNAGERIHFSRVGVEYLGKTYLSGYRQALRNAATSSRSSPAPRVTVAAKQPKVTSSAGP